MKAFTRYTAAAGAGPRPSACNAKDEVLVKGSGPEAHLRLTGPVLLGLALLALRRAREALSNPVRQRTARKVQGMPELRSASKVTWRGPDRNAGERGGVRNSRRVRPLAVSTAKLRSPLVAS